MPPVWRLLLALCLVSACYAKKAADPRPMSSGGLMDPGHAGAPDAGDLTDAPAPDDATDATPADASPLPDLASASDSATDTAPDDAAATMTGDGPTLDGPAVRTDAPAADVAAGPDGAVDRGPDASPSLSPYLTFLDDAWMAWRIRWSSCFNSPPEALTADRSPLADAVLDTHGFSLDHGLVTFDAARGRACLDALRNDSCAQLAAGAFFTPCLVLVGQVDTGGFCVSPDDCRLASDGCEPIAASGCQYRCAPLAPTAAIGEPCDSRSCSSDGACYMTPGDPLPVCHALTQTGAACSQSTCRPDAWCEPAAADTSTGTCQAVGPGRPCTGGWQCPSPYACVIAAGATTGTCGPGRQLGESCTLQGLLATDGPFSDCADQLHCLPDGTGHDTCSLGRDLGGACGDLDVGGVNPLSVPCRVGNCRTGPAGDPICLLDGHAGDDCTDDRPCELGFVCETGKCHDAHVGLGDRCTLDGTYFCPDGARCAPALTGDGACVPLKKAGEACDDPDACALGLSCAAGSCQACH